MVATEIDGKAAKQEMRSYLNNALICQKRLWCVMFLQYVLVLPLSEFLAMSSIPWYSAWPLYCCLQLLYSIYFIKKKKIQQNLKCK